MKKCNIQKKEKWDESKIITGRKKRKRMGWGLSPS